MHHNYLTACRRTGNLEGASFKSRAEVHPQRISKRRRQWLHRLVRKPVLLDLRCGAEQELEPAFAHTHCALETFVNRVDDQRQRDVERRVGLFDPLPLNERAESIDATYALLELCRVPRQIVVYDATTVM